MLKTEIIMKELPIEEKAKRYDERLERATIAYKDEDRHLKATLERIFPELKESNDERIRKELIKETKSSEVRLFETVTNEEFIAWLEKQQGEQISANSCKTCKDEQKPIEREELISIPFGAYDSELVSEIITIPNGCYATIEDNKIHIKKGKVNLHLKP